MISSVTVEQAYGGMRGVKSLVCDTSEVPPDKGLIVREIPIAHLTDKLPEEILWLLLTGELPDAAELADLQADLRARSTVPSYVWAVLSAMPADSHPMVMLSTAILVLERESVFRQRYDAGIKKDEYWVATLEDTLNIVAKLPAIAAGIYRSGSARAPRIASNPALDWAADYAHMLGIADPTRRVREADAALHGAALRPRERQRQRDDDGDGELRAVGPLLLAVGRIERPGGPAARPGEPGMPGLDPGYEQEVRRRRRRSEQLKKYAEDTLAAGRVVPGYGHAVLRITDPRFDAFLAFGKKHCPNDPVFQTVANVFDTVPDVLKQVQKIKDPWPNVDAGSGSLLYHYGLTEFPYYTVLFACRAHSASARRPSWRARSASRSRGRSR